MSAKINRLVKAVVTTIETADVKGDVGDSTNNNRVPSVNQVIRFLTSTNYALSSDLRRVYRSLQKNKAFKRLRRNNNRTDAIDINELVEVVSRTNGNTKRELGQRIFWII